MERDGLTSQAAARPGTTATGSTEPGTTSPPATPSGFSRGDVVRTAVAGVAAVALLVAAAFLSRASGPTAASALLFGAGLGVLFERGRFCFFCISRDAAEGRGVRGIYSILTAIAVGSVGYVLVFSLRLPDPSSGQLPGGAHIAPVSLALVVAGFVFGLGVVVSGGCIAGHLYRLGEGNLRALPALVGALVGFGVGFLTWNPLYDLFIAGAPAVWLPSGSGYGVALVLQLALLAGIAVWLLRWNEPSPAVPHRDWTPARLHKAVFGTRWPALATGAGVGLIGVAAYLRDCPLGVTSQLSSLSRSTLDGYGLLPATLRGLDETLGGCVALVVDTITSNGWLVIGIVVGSLLAALPGGRFTVEIPTLRQSATAVLGGAALGWGAITGLGCTVGVVLSGTQALSASGWVFSAALVGGLALGFRAGWHRS